MNPYRFHVYIYLICFFRLAYVAFASEEAAEKNFKLIDGVVIKGSKITVDYVGSKSKFKSDKTKKKPGSYHLLLLSCSFIISLL